MPVAGTVCLRAIGLGPGDGFGGQSPQTVTSAYAFIWGCFGEDWRKNRGAFPG